MLKPYATCGCGLLVPVVVAWGWVSGPPDGARPVWLELAKVLRTVLEGASVRVDGRPLTEDGQHELLHRMLHNPGIEALDTVWRVGGIIALKQVARERLADLITEQVAWKP